MCESKIDILLATYNGEKYLRAQLYSILYQDCSNWRLLVHDDGSMDNTVEIVKGFMQYDNRICLIEDNVTGLGPGGNFMHLLQYATAPFICFSDQDDIWFENKLSSLLQIIVSKDNSKPQIVCCNFLTWSNGQIGFLKLFELHGFNEFLFQNGGIQGCACLFNVKTKEVMQHSFEYIAMHDHLLGLIGIANNAIEYYDEPLFFYRRHTENVTVLSRNFITALKNRSSVVSGSYYKANLAFFQEFSENMSKRQRRLFKLYIDCSTGSFLYRFAVVLFCRFKVSKSKIRLLGKLIFCKYMDD